MAEIPGHKGPSQSAARPRAPSVELPRRQPAAVVPTTKWQRYLHRIRLLVGRNAHR